MARKQASPPPTAPRSGTMRRRAASAPLCTRTGGNARAPPRRRAHPCAPCRPWCSREAATPRHARGGASSSGGGLADARARCVWAPRCAAGCGRAACENWPASALCAVTWQAAAPCQRAPPRRRMLRASALLRRSGGTTCTRGLALAAASDAGADAAAGSRDACAAPPAQTAVTFQLSPAAARDKFHAWCRRAPALRRGATRARAGALTPRPAASAGLHPARCGTNATRSSSWLRRCCPSGPSTPSSTFVTEARLRVQPYGTQAAAGGPPPARLLTCARCACRGRTCGRRLGRLQAERQAAAALGGGAGVA
jgi:hypothetical protein